MNNKNQLNLFSTGKERRDLGMAQALAHADNVHENWSERAYKFLLKFLATHPGSFLTEEVITLAKGILPEPPDPRAWGGVVTRARKEGHIRSLGYGQVKNPQAHARPGTIWIKN